MARRARKTVKTARKVLEQQLVQRVKGGGGGSVAGFNIFKELRPLIFSSKHNGLKVKAKASKNKRERVSVLSRISEVPAEDEYLCNACTSRGIFYRYTSPSEKDKRLEANIYDWDELDMVPIAQLDVFLKRATTLATSRRVRKEELEELEEGGASNEKGGRGGAKKRAAAAAAAAADGGAVLQAGKQMTKDPPIPDAKAFPRVFYSPFRAKIGNVGTTAMDKLFHSIVAQRGGGGGGAAFDSHGFFGDIFDEDEAARTAEKGVDLGMDEKFENLVGYLLGNGELIKRHKKKPCSFKYACNSFGTRVPERCSQNEFNRNHKFDRHWLDFMDVLHDSLPYVAANDISYVEGEWYSRQLQYRVHTHPHPRMDELYGKFMTATRARKTAGVRRLGGKFVKCVPEDIEAYLTPRALAHWFLDKGSMQVSTDHASGDAFECYTLLLDNFTAVDDLQRLQRGLNDRYGMNVVLSHEESYGESGYVPHGAEFNSRLFVTSEEDKEKFVETVSPYIPATLSSRLVKVPEPLLETKMVGAYTSLHKSDRSSADYMGGSLTADLEQMLVSM